MSHSKVSFYTYKTKEKSIPFFSFIRERNFLSNFFQLPFKPEGWKKNVCKVLTFSNLLFSSNWCFTSTKSKSSWIHCVISAVYVSTVTSDSQNSKEERLQQYIFFYKTQCERTTISLASSSNVITFSSNSKSGCRLWPASDSLSHDLAKTILYVPVFKLPWWLSVSFKFIFSSDLAKGCLWNPIHSIDLLYNQSNTCFL